MSRFPFPLRFSIPVILLVFGGILGIISFQQEVSRANSRAERDITEQATFSASQTSGLLEYQYRYANGKGAALIISQIATAPNLQLALLCDENNKVLFSSRFDMNRRRVRNTPASDAWQEINKVQETQSGQVILSEDRQTLRAIYPVVLGAWPGEILPSRVGVLFLEYNLSTLKAQTYQHALERSLVYSVALALLCTILWLIFSTTLTWRVDKLVAASKSLAQGNLTVRANLQGSDELAQISKAFDLMAEEIQINTEDLHQKQEELQQALNNLQATQSQLIHAEKMSGLGQMVAGIAHEINNPVNFIHANLTYVNQYAQDLLDIISLYQKVYPYLEDELVAQLRDIDLQFIAEDFPQILTSMKVGTERISQIVNSLRNFSRYDESELKFVDIHEGIDSTLLILQHRLKQNKNLPGIEIKKDYSNLPEVECYAGQLNQVFMNVISNAIDALIAQNEKNKALKLSEIKGQIQIRTEAKTANSVVVAIADNGLGIPREVQQRIFDPFFTTKPIGKGTGLGLSISYQIVVEKHGGQLKCISTPGEGAEFLIVIPVKQSGRTVEEKRVSISAKDSD